MADTFDFWLRETFRRDDRHEDGPRLVVTVLDDEGREVRRELTREQVVRLADHLLAEALLMPRPGDPTGADA